MVDLIQDTQEKTFKEILKGKIVLFGIGNTLRERDAQSRQDRIVRAFKEMDKLKSKLEGPRCRYTTFEGVELAVKKILSDTDAQAWISHRIHQWKKESYRQERRGRPGKDMRWRRRVKLCFRLSWDIIEEKIQEDTLSDGVFPLLTNCNGLPILEVLTAYKSKQPFVEKRHDLLKNTLEVTPVFFEEHQPV